MRKILYLAALIFLVSCGNAPVNKLDLNVMSFNIRYDNPEDSLNNWQYRKDISAQLIKDNNVDLLGTQEVLSNQMVDLKGRLTDYTAIGVGREDGIDKGEYSAIFYKTAKFDELKSGWFWLSETPELAGSKGWDGACERIATWAVLKDKETSRELIFINTHLDHVGQEARREGIALIIARAEELATGLPVIFTGDLNAKPDSEVIQHVLASDNKPQLFNSKNLAKETKGNEGTFHAFGRIPLEKRSFIDYIFVSANVDVKSHQVLEDKVGDQYISDHNPILAEITIN